MNEKKSSYSEETLLEFPCEFPIKAMGKQCENLEEVVFNIVKKHAPEAVQENISTNLSKNGKYISVTVTIEAQSKNQLDAIYYDLTATPEILYAL